jgi:TRAP-type transport system periplasmic protein
VKSQKIHLLLILMLMFGIILTVNACTESTPAPTPTPSTPQDSTPASTPEITPTELSFASYLTPEAPSYIAMQEWADKIKQESNGALTIRFYPIGTLVDPAQMRTGVKEGIADIGCSGPFMWDEKLTLGLYLTVLIRAKDTVTAGKIYDDVWNEFPDLMAKEWEDYKVLWLSPIQPTFLGTVKTPVRKLEDFKGLQIRTTGKEQSDFIQSVGGTPVSVSTGDFVVNLEKKIVDGGVFIPSFMADFKLCDQIKYYTWFSFGGGWPSFVIMNKESWNKLHPDLQKIVDDNLEWGKQIYTDSWINSEEAGIEYMESCNVEMIELSDQEKERWNNALAPAFQNIENDLNDKGYPGTEIVNFVLERNNYYSTQ